MRICRLVLAATILAGSAAHAQKWIDAATGKPVDSGPIAGAVPVSGSHQTAEGNTVYETAIRPTDQHVPVGVKPDAGDPTHAFDPISGRNFVFDSDACQWTDAATGKPVDSGPIAGAVPVSGSHQTAEGNTVYESPIRPTDQHAAVVIKPDSSDPTHAFDPVSGRNFVRVDDVCPPKKAQDSQQPQTTNQVGSATQQLKPFDQRILDMQNAERTALGLQPLHWSPTLAQHAQDYANQLAQTGQLTHSSREGRGIERENLNQGMLDWGADQMLQNWLSEKQHLVPGTFPNVSDTGNWLDVGHITQILWPTTTDVGCGDATGSGFQWLVCRYSPGGNKDGVGVGFAAAGGVGPATAMTGVALAAGAAPDLPGVNEKPLEPNVRIDSSWGSAHIPAVQPPNPAPPVVIHIGGNAPTFPAGPGSNYAQNAAHYVTNTPEFNYGYRRGQNAAYGILSDAVIGGGTSREPPPQKRVGNGNQPAATRPDLVKDVMPEAGSTPPDLVKDVTPAPGSATPVRTSFDLLYTDPILDGPSTNGNRPYHAELSGHMIFAEGMIPGTDFDPIGPAAIGVSPTITIETNIAPPELPGMEFTAPQPDRPELEKM